MHPKVIAILVCLVLFGVVCEALDERPPAYDGPRDRGLHIQALEAARSFSREAGALFGGIKDSALQKTRVAAGHVVSHVHHREFAMNSLFGWLTILHSIHCTYKYFSLGLKEVPITMALILLTRSTYAQAGLYNANQHEMRIWYLFFYCFSICFGYWTWSFLSYFGVYAWVTNTYRGEVTWSALIAILCNAHQYAVFAFAWTLEAIIMAMMLENHVRVTVYEHIAFYRPIFTPFLILATILFIKSQ